MSMRFRGPNPQFNEFMERARRDGLSSDQLIRESPQGSALAKLRSIAEKFMAADPSLTFSAAVAKATLANPRLYEEYETERGQ